MLATLLAMLNTVPHTVIDDAVIITSISVMVKKK